MAKTPSLSALRRSVEKTVCFTSGRYRSAVSQSAWRLPYERHSDHRPPEGHVQFEKIVATALFEFEAE